MKEFGSLLAFAEHVGKVAVELVIAEHEGLERACIIVETEAKASIGEYQGQAGPFAAWAELADATKADRSAQGYPDNEPELRSGETRDSIEHKVVGKDGWVGSDSEILEYQELGTSHMPARSILGGAAFRKTDEVVHVIAADVVLALMGEEVHKARLLIE